MVRHAAARRLIGYLPEKTPLYPDMTAREYLRFVCELKRVPRERCVQEVERVCAFMQLKEMDKLIGFLPEAARRRLGLAQMLVGDPPVLIFDEPTFGLDPRATAELRASIKEMSRGHTVVLASRLLHEVTELCEAVVVINRGRLAVNTPIVRLSAYAGDKVRIRVRLQAAPEQARRLLTGLAAAPEVESLPASEEGAVDFIVESEEDVRGALWDAACAQGIRMLEMKRINVSLEDVFLQLTGDVQEDGDESGF